MDNNFTSDKFPQSPYYLYLQLYCKRKGVRNKKTLQDAKKSWLSMNPLRKKRFCETIHNTNLMKNAHFLSKTETFLKPKPTVLCYDTVMEEGQEQIKEVDKNEINMLEDDSAITLDASQNPAEDRLRECEIQNDESNSKIVQNLPNLNSAKDEKNLKGNNQDDDAITDQNSRSLADLGTINDQENFETDTQEDENTVRDSNIRNELELNEIQNTPSSPERNEDVNIPLIEPAPPTLKDGRHLYNIVKPSDSIDWKDLSLKEKRQYHAAARTIKRDYIKNYTKYLESLSQQQLYDHYVKTFH